MVRRRLLPWQIKDTKVQTSLKRATKSGPSKRKRSEKSTPASESDDVVRSSKSGKSRGPSSSPPPSPPPESFMEEGVDRDDRYRMVEDELLAMAQKFTVHLHAAEYKRQRNVVQSRNAETINTISRPTVGKMPDETRRRIEGVECAEKQRKLIGTLKNGRNSSDTDSDSGPMLPYAGTMLHGLMDSPRKRATSLARISNATLATRSAAGFKKPAAHSKDPMYDSPKQTVKLKASKVDVIDNTTASSNDEDDLDAPLPAPKFIKSEPPTSPTVKPSFRFVKKRGEMDDFETHILKSLQPITRPDFLEKKTEPAASSRNLPISIQTPPKPVSGPPKLSRFERARQARERDENASKGKNAPEIIPTFL